MNDNIPAVVPAPCGCFICPGDGSYEYQSVSASLHIVECRWCGATFTHDDELKQWFLDHVHDAVPFFLSAPSRLCLFGGTVLEIIRPCRSCSQPIMREWRSVVEFHFNGPQDAVTLLSN